MNDKLGNHDKGIIQVLDLLTANQIAAGEVVERPVSVVKELIENSIDAGAKRITIKIMQHSTMNQTEIAKIELVDDGCGMILADLFMAFKPHATSKISTVDDLGSIFTLGFRGEALASIAAVSKVTISSKKANQLAGNILEVVDGKPNFISEVGMPEGTKIQIEDLFYNTPARKKFLKATNIEIGYITALIAQMILSRPDISFVYTLDNRTVLHSSGNGDIRQAITAIYGSESASSLAKVFGNGKVKINGFISKPSFTRSSRKYYHFFVNGRVVKSKDLINIVETAYHTLLPEKRYPMAVIYLDIAPELIDVNVHPAKTEIRFANLNLVKDEMLAAIKEALSFKVENTPEIKSKPVAYIIDDEDNNFILKENKRPGGDDLVIVPDSQKQKPDLSGILNNSSSLNSSKEPAESFASKLFANLVGVKPSNFATEQQEETYEQQQVFPKPSNIFEILKPMGQIDSSFIIASGGKDLYVIDQHAAHERVMYEQFCKIFADLGQETSMLAFPISIDLGGLQKEYLLQNIMEINTLGFIVEHFGDNTFIIRGVPLWYVQGQESIKKSKGDIFKQEVTDFFLTMLNKVSDSSSKIKITDINSRELFSIACKSAVKGNQNLNQSDILWLINALAKAEKPMTCPHGRPTVVKITDEEIRKRFMR